MNLHISVDVGRGAKTQILAAKCLHSNHSTTISNHGNKCFPTTTTIRGSVRPLSRPIRSEPHLFRRLQELQGHGDRSFGPAAGLDGHVEVEDVDGHLAIGFSQKTLRLPGAPNNRPGPFSLRTMGCFMIVPNQITYLVCVCSK